MSFNFLSSIKTVLLIADEAVHVFRAGGQGVKALDSIEWGAEDFERQLLNAIIKKGGRKPVLILNDMVEQHYRKEKIVKSGAGFGDKASMVKRKLNVAFPNYPVRAAFPLKEKIKKSKGQLAADVYIFAAVPNSVQFNQTMAATSKSLASVAGFCLLPVESSDMLKALSQRLSKDKKAKAAKWCIFVGQHRSGGLRQVVTKNGEIALTRMTPVTQDAGSHSKWASEVHQELKSTMSYLSRFGYVPEDSLDIIVIASQESGDLLMGLTDTDNGANVFTMAPYEAAKLLNIKLGRVEPDSAHYADVLHVAWAARKGSLILPMKAEKVDEVSQPRKIALAASVLLSASAAFLSYQAVVSYEGLSAVKEQLTSANNSKAQLDVQYQKELSKKEGLGFDVKLVQTSIKVRDQMNADSIDTIKFFSKIGKAMGKDLRIDKVLIDPYLPEGPIANISRFGKQEPTNDPLFSTRLQMTYPSTADIEKGNNEVRDLRSRLSAVLGGYDVKVTKLLKDYEYTEGLVVQTGDLDTKDLSQDFLAEITIEGPKKEAKTQ